METIKTLLLQSTPSAGGVPPPPPSSSSCSPNNDDLLISEPDFIPPLPKTKQPPVIVGVAVKRTLLRGEVPPPPASQIDILEQWHSDIFDYPKKDGNDCNNNNGEVVGVDNDGVDLIDFSTEIEASPVQNVAKPKVKKVTFLLEEEEDDGDGEEEEEDECVTKEGEWDVSDTVEVWEEEEEEEVGRPAGNEISTETMQTDDIVSIGDDEDVGKDSVQCACSTLDDGRRDCQHLAARGGWDDVPKSVVDPRASGDRSAVPTASSSTNTLTELLVLVNSDTAPRRNGERKIDELERSASRQNACAEAGNAGRRRRLASESIDATVNGKDPSSSLLLVDIGEEDAGSTGAVTRTPKPEAERRIDETAHGQHSPRPCAKQVENVVTAAPPSRSVEQQLEQLEQRQHESLQLCEKSIQVPSPSRRPEQPRGSAPATSSDSESENYYGTCSPSPPPPVVPPSQGGIPPPTQSYGLNVEVTLNAHISVHGLSEFGFFAAERGAEDPSGGGQTEKVLRDSATNTGGNNNVTPSSADSGIIIIDDDGDECGVQEAPESQEVVVIEDCFERKQQLECRDQDTQTLNGSFPQKNTSEISVQVCANGDSDLRLDDSSVSESEIDERKDLRFLTKNTDQYLRPPLNFLSEKHECFEASNRLKRLEERFRGFAYTKKLLRESAANNSNGGGQNLSSSLSSLSTLLADCTTNTSAASQKQPASSSSSTAIDAVSSQTDSTFVPSWKTSSLSCLQSSPDNDVRLNHVVPKPAPVLPPLTSSLLSLSASSLLSLSCLDQQRQQQKPQQDDCSQTTQNNKPNTPRNHLSKASSLPSLLPQYLFPAPPTRTPPKPPQLPEQVPEEDPPKPFRPPLATPESSVASEEICTIFPGGKPRVQDPLEVLEPTQLSEDSDEEEEDPDCEEFLNLEKLLAADPHTNCEFDTRHFAQYEPQVYQIKYCYDELEEELEGESATSVGGLLIGPPESVSVLSATNREENEEDGCACVIEAVPIYRTLPLVEMRETTGTLRGLLKKPNRPPPVRKNRVVFDETRNEFFEADYIILIREDCPYDEEDEEPCTCGEHELVRICCDEGCNCGYTTAAPADDGRTPPSPKFAPPMEFVDQATLSPPEGYKDGSGLLDNALGGALGGHVFGAQHIQQLQVIQRLQQQRAAMLAARAAAGQQGQQTGSTQTSSGGGGTGASPAATAAATGQPAAAAATTTTIQQQPQTSPQQQTVCTECAECAECAAKQLHDEECDSQCSDDISPMMEPPLPPHATLPIALVPLQKSSPERRITQKEIIAGEERPKFLTIKQVQDAAQGSNEAGSTAVPPSSNADLRTLQQQQQKQLAQQLQRQQSQDGGQPPPTGATPAGGHYEIGGKHKPLSTAQAISGILKGGKLWKNEQQPGQSQQQQQQMQQQQQQLQQQQHNQQQQSAAQHEDSTNVTSDEETSSKRSVRFTEESTIRDGCCDGEVQSGLGEGEMGSGKPINYMSDTLKRHSSGLFHNALRPNSAVRQLFPQSLTSAGAVAATVMTATTTMATMGAMPGAVCTTSAGAAPGGHPTALTQEALKAFDDSKKATLVHQHSITSNSSSCNIPACNSTANSVTGAGGSPGGPGETDTIRRTIERNALRRSLIKYEPKKKIPVKDVTSLEERIRQLTCDIDEPIDEGADGNEGDLSELERRDSPAGEENPQQPKYIPDKSFSPSSSASSSSSGSNGSTYKKITDLFHRDRRQEKIPEADENPIVIIPQVSWDCRCPAGPDIGMGVQIQGGHTQIHQPPQQRQADSRRQFLSTLAPLTACVAGQRDDLSYYTLAHPGDRNSLGSSQCTEYSLGDIDAALHDDDGKKVAPDVIAGTPGQESDELAAFVQQEGARTERLKKRYSTETSTSAPASGAGSDDDEHNDYGFNSRPSVRGIKPRFGSTNEILQQMQAQLAAPAAPPPKSSSSVANAPTQPIQSNTLPRPHTSSSLQLAAAKQQITTHQHTASWSYYPVDNGTGGGAQSKAVATVAAGTNMVTAVDPHGNYYHIPAQARHSYHGQEAIYQNCAQLPAGNIQANTVHVQSQQIHTQHHAVHHIHPVAAAGGVMPGNPVAAAAAAAAYGKFARSPTRRPESPPPLRNYHQTMVLIPYNAETYQRYTAQEQENYRRQHNIVEYQQVTQQTIRVPVGYPLPGMQLHVVAGRGALPPHYSTLPRLGSSSSSSGTSGSIAAATSAASTNSGPPPLPPPQGKPPAYSQYASQQPPPLQEKPPGLVKFTGERGAPEGAASVQPADAASMLSPTSAGHGPPTLGAGASSAQGGAGAAPSQQGAVFYAMNV
ncbi:uncharacterized protein LOC120413919 isoform X2 [Culex pipiens pallens]|uniref:uncharacterized protein LOC120413919 isoform X2 n=1 Tax=Culex pipiens pallens TaxID=42434 RepID=UPI0019537ED5|nr:uncharacterized protein LOC120413919 isoform X2 [Culex pipiens pallens]